MGTQPARFLMTASIAYSGSISGADLLFWIFARSQANPYCASASGSSILMLKAETWCRCLVRVLRRPIETAGASRTFIGQRLLSRGDRFNFLVRPPPDLPD